MEVHKSAPLFTKQVGSNTFAIYRVLSNQAYWYIGRWDKTLNDEIQRLYKSNLYTRESILIPPENGWVSCNKKRSPLEEVTTCHFLSKAAASSAAATAVNELIVSGCGLPIVNGTYKRANQTFQGLPMYKKTAGQITVTISSSFDEKRQKWEIYEQGAKTTFESIANDRVDGKLDGAPLDNSTWWLTNGEWVEPPPQVKRG